MGNSADIFWNIRFGSVFFFLISKNWSWFCYVFIFWCKFTLPETSNMSNIPGIFKREGLCSEASIFGWKLLGFRGRVEKEVFETT